MAPAHIRAGRVDLVVRNRGPESHELIVVRADGPLPMRTDGVTVDEDAFEKVTVGALEPGRPGETRHLHVTLKPGHYVLICNMSGHYLGGMRTPVEVDVMRARRDFKPVRQPRPAYVRRDPRRLRGRSRR